MEKQIGLVIREIAAEKNLSAAKLSALLGKSRQAIYNTFAKASMSDLDLQEWAKALNVTPEYITSRWKGKDNRSQDNGAFGDKILSEIRKMFEEELREKNDQIRALQEALKSSQELIKMAMGKPDLSEGKPTCEIEMPVYQPEVEMEMAA